MANDFAKIPKDILKSKISSDAKVLYACLADRHSLSQKNGWIDDDGRIYVIFPVSEVMEVLHCSKVKARRVLSELGNLIERKRRGQGKPDIIYINISCTADDLSAEFFDKSYKNELQEENIVSLKKDNSEPSKGLADDLQDDLKITPNNNNINNNNFNNNYINNPSNPINPYNWIEERKEYIKIIKSNIEYDYLITNRSKSIIDDIVSVMANAVCSRRDFIKISGEEVPQEVVKEKLLSFDYSHIEYVYDCISKNKTSVKNMSAYLLTSLYNAHDVINIHYANMAYADMAR